MAENSRMKKLPIAVLAAPALAFGSLTLTAVPALAVPADEVTQILDEVDTIVVVAEQDTDVYRDGEVNGVINTGAVISAIDYEEGQLVAYDGARYDADHFSHASEEQYAELNAPFPSLLQEDDEDEESEETPLDEENGSKEEPVDENVEENDVDEDEAQNDAPVINIDSVFDEILPGDVVDVDGSGFAPDSTVAFSIDSGELETIGGDDILTREDGTFAGSIFLPDDIAAGTHQVVATGSAEGEEATFEITVLDWEDLLAPELSVNVAEARVGDTVRFTIDNVDELLEEYGSESELLVEGYVADAEGTVGAFESLGISAVDNSTGVFEFTIPASIKTDEGELNIGRGAQFVFEAGIILELSDGEEIGFYSNFVAVDILGDEVVVNPELTVSAPEVTLEDFVGDPLEGAGVLHELTGFKPGTEIEYSVATPEGIEPFSQSGFIGDEGEAAFTIYGEDSGDTSVYLGDYTTTVTFVDDNDETQELTASFSVVPGDTGVAPVVDTQSTGEAPAVGASADNLAKTGASGTQLALLAGGLLVLGGAALALANRRLRSRNN